MKNCCDLKNNYSAKKCKRKSDNKIFNLPRKFSKKKCINEKIKGFSMKSSCSPWINCRKKKKIKSNHKKKKSNKLSIMKNILNTSLKKCSTQPMTGYYRDGYCRTGADDLGTHTVCAKMDKKFLEYTKNKGNNLYSVVKPGENWCLCEYRWNQAYQDGVAPQVILESTNKRTDENITNNIHHNLNMNKFTK